MTQLPPSPFIDPDRRFVLDEDAFMAAIEEAPVEDEPDTKGNGTVPPSDIPEHAAAH